MRLNDSTAHGYTKAAYHSAVFEPMRPAFLSELSAGLGSAARAARAAQVSSQVPHSLSVLRALGPGQALLWRNILRVTMRRKRS